MYCSTCGSKLENSDKFCPICGNKIILTDNPEVASEEVASEKCDSMEETDSLSIKSNKMKTSACGEDLEAYDLGYLDIFNKVFFKKYATFSGRACRREFWGAFLTLTLFFYIFGLVLALLAFSNNSSGFYVFGILCALILHIVCIIPLLAVTVRRLHDTDRSGWWVLVNFIPILGTIVFLIFLSTRGTPASNRYGNRQGYIPIDEELSRRLKLSKSPSRLMTILLVVIYFAYPILMIMIKISSQSH